MPSPRDLVGRCSAQCRGPFFRVLSSHAATRLNGGEPAEPSRWPTTARSACPCRRGGAKVHTEVGRVLVLGRFREFRVKNVPCGARRRSTSSLPRHCPTVTRPDRSKAPNDETLPELVSQTGFSSVVDAMEHYGNRRPRVERLVSAWAQGPGSSGEPDSEPDDPLIGAAAEPRGRPRTRLTDEEVDAMRTARANGVSVTALAKQFGVHRGTVWTTTRIKSP